MMLAAGAGIPQGPPRADAVDAAGGAPLCATCDHHHHGHDKCKVCGHDGKIVIFPGPDGPHPPPSTFHLTAFDASTCTAATLAGNFALLRIMRTRVFVTELKVKGDIDELDTSSRHILGLIGEAPVSYARWRVVPTALLDNPGLDAQAVAAAAAGPISIVIERLLVLAEYRHRGFGKATLQYAVFDAAQRLPGNTTRPISKVSIFVPSTSACALTARCAVSIGMKAVGTERPDPTNWWTEGNVWEFSVPFPEQPAQQQR